MKKRSSKKTFISFKMISFLSKCEISRQKMTFISFKMISFWEVRNIDAPGKEPQSRMMPGTSSTRCSEVAFFGQNVY